MTPELEAELRSSALEGLSRVKHDVLGLMAADTGDRFGRSVFGRDTAVASIEAASSVPDLIPNLVMAQDLLAQHIGKESNPKTHEEKGLLPHEYRPSFSDQRRMRGLGRAFHLEKGEDGRYILLNYCSSDVNPLDRIATYVIYQAIDDHFGRQEARDYLARRWPVVLATLNHDTESADIDRDGLPESWPKTPLVNTNWKDSKWAYVDEKRKIPTAPYKFFTVACDYAWSLEATSMMALAMDEVEMAKKLARQYLQIVDQIHSYFYMEDLGTYSPLIDGNGNQLKIICDDPIEGLWTNVLYPDYAARVADRLMQDDMLTRWGVRTRSSNSNGFFANGPKAYHNGAVWAHRNHMLREGALNYGMTDIAREIDDRTASLEQLKGPIELVAVPQDGKLEDYLERTRPVACKTQAWAAAGRAGSTLNTPREHRERAKRKEILDKLAA